MLYYLSLGLTVLSNTVYHIFQKLTPANVNPAVALFVTYATAAAACAVYAAIRPPEGGIWASLRQVNGASIGLGFAIVGLELGFLLAYRAGWNIGLAGIVSMVLVTLALLPIAVLAFRERITPLNLLGVLVCIAGLLMVTRR